MFSYLTAQVAEAESSQIRLSIATLTPYFSYLVPSDFFLFLELKSDLRGRHFLNNDELIYAAGDFLEDQHSIFFRDRNAMFEYRLTKGIALKMWVEAILNLLRNLPRFSKYF